MATQNAQQQIRLADDLGLPLDIATDTLGVLAIKDGGKSYAAMLLVEQLVKARLPVVAIDPVGVFWGLRVAGKGPGLPIVILGGDHGDVPIEPTAGRAVADFVVAERQPVVIDFRGFHTKAEQFRFSLDFLTRLYEANREVLHVVIDEADELAPQKPFGEETRVLRAVEVLVRRGRARGLGCTLITQRPAVLNKNVLTQCSTLVVGRMMAPQDRKAVEAWVEAHGTEEQKRQMMDSLATLPKYDKWVWAPARDVFQRVRIAERTTFDSSATPKVGLKRIEPKTLAQVDLGALRSKMAETIERAKAEDPAYLKRRVAELQAQLARGPLAAAPPRPAPTTVVKVIERVPDWVDKKLQQALGASQKSTEMVLDLMQRVQQINDGAQAKVIEAKTTEATSVVQPATSTRSERPARTRVEHAETVPVEDGDMKLSRGEKRILARLGLAPDGMSSLELGVATGYTHDGGGFRNQLGRLRSLKLIDGANERMRLSRAGAAHSHDGAKELCWGDELVTQWCRQLIKAERAILACVWKYAPSPVSVETVARETEYESTGGGFRNALGHLRSLGLIDGKNELTIHPVFMYG